MWRNPEEIIERLIGVGERDTRRADAKLVPPPRVARDRHYTRARQLHVKQLMKGK